MIFHQPDNKVPRRAAEALGFSYDQYAAGFLVEDIGSTHAGSVLLSLSAVLDVATAGERILVVSFGAGAGSDAFSLVVTDRIYAPRLAAPCVSDYVKRRRDIDYATYARFQGKFYSN